MYYWIKFSEMFVELGQRLTQTKTTGTEYFRTFSVRRIGSNLTNDNHDGSFPSCHLNLTANNVELPFLFDSMLDLQLFNPYTCLFYYCI